MPKIERNVDSRWWLSPGEILLPRYLGAGIVEPSATMICLMARVEWPVLEGDQVETLLSNLIYNMDGRSTRVRPSQGGDYGIDVIRPARHTPTSGI
jgi:hypothetical protein